MFYKHDNSYEMCVSLQILSRGMLRSASTVASGSVVKIPIRISPEMIPSFRVIAYYYDTNGDVIANSVWVDVEDKCEGKVHRCQKAFHIFNRFCKFIIKLYSIVKKIAKCLQFCCPISYLAWDKTTWQSYISTRWYRWAWHWRRNAEECKSGLTSCGQSHLRPGCSKQTHSKTGVFFSQKLRPNIHIRKNGYWIFWSALEFLTVSHFPVKRCSPPCSLMIWGVRMVVERTPLLFLMMLAWPSSPTQPHSVQWWEKVPNNAQERIRLVLLGSSSVHERAVTICK